MAEVAEKTVKKGSQLYIVGKIKTRSYVDKEGNNKYITEILADTFLVLDKKPAAAGSTGTSSEPARSDTPERDNDVPEANDPAAGYQASGDDDLPF
jgi:single-strand DNA-binding protein